MGVFFSIFNHCNEVKHEFEESVIVKSISFGHEGGKTPVRSVSFKGRDLEPLILKSSDSGEMILEGSVSFKKKEFETKPSVDALTPMPHSPLSPILDPNNPKHAAAIKLQKVYKSFRTRRKLADCAVLVEQSWWKLLDFAELKRSSISFFDIEKHETAVSRWSRARTRAAKVGKGLSKNDKAQKLALQHWLEAIDPRHRYGHNLHLYYDKWLHSQSQQPFFYWLDIGEGKEINLLDTCPRSKLQQQCIKYLGPRERQAYEVIVEDGKFFYKQTGELLNTTGYSKWIFVLSASKTLYIGKKIKGTFQHSSFLAGGATTAAGRLVIEQGVLKAVWPHSGHYRPTEENFKEFISFLRENHVDLTEVKMSPVDDDEYSIKRSSSSHGSHNSAEFDLSQEFNLLETDEIEMKDETLVVSDNEVQQTSSTLELPKAPLGIRDEAEPNTVVSSDDLEVKTPDRRVAEDSHVESIPRETILQRINSKKGSNSYQLGKQLSCKWTTGAGPRIGCVRDYPTELQFQALEQVNLSPRGDNEHKLLCFSPRSTNCLSPRLEIRRSTSEELHWPTSPMFKKQKSLRRRIQSNLHSPRFREAPVAATLANA